MVDMKKMHMISIVWGSILFLLVIGLTLFGFYFKKQTKIYKEFETKIEENTKEFIVSKPLVEGHTKYNLEELLEEKVIDTNEINNKKCSGYVDILYEKETYQIKAYINCGMYKTRGF